MPEKKVKIKMGERCYQGWQWDDVLQPGGVYEVPATFGEYLVNGSFAKEVVSKAKAAPKDGD